MKQFRYFIWIPFICILLNGCKKEELMTYTSPDSIYFPWTDGSARLINDTWSYPTDSITATFSWSGSEVTDTIIRIPVAIAGSPSSKDREYLVVADEGSTMVPGTHYLMPDHFIFRAGMVTDTIAIKFLRSGGYGEDFLWLNLQLKPNENFSLNIGYGETMNAAGDLLVFNPGKFRIRIDDRTGTPQSWIDFELDYIFGTFSRKKISMMMAVLNVPVTVFMSYNGDYPYFATVMNRYLVEQAAAGNTIYEEDGSVMQMGAGYRAN